MADRFVHEPRPPHRATSPKGERSRQAILTAAANLATTHGLEGLSIGDLAAHLNMSKSGLYAHFQSKQELALATVDAASGIFEREVIAPAGPAPAGVRRLRALAEAFLGHVQRRVFPGGCFFAAVVAEQGARPGPVRDRVAQVVADWLALLTRCLEEAKQAGEIRRDVDVPQAVFEVESMLMAANFLFVMSDDPATLDRARTGIDALLVRLAKKKSRD